MLLRVNYLEDVVEVLLLFVNVNILFEISHHWSTMMCVSIICNLQPANQFASYTIVLDLMYH